MTQSQIKQGVDISRHFSDFLSTVFALLLSIGTFFTIDYLLDSHLSLGEMIIYPSIILFTLFLITRSKKVLLVSLAVIAVVFGILCAVNVIPIASYIKLFPLYIENISVNVAFPASPHLDGAFKFFCIVIFLVLCVGYYIFSVVMRTNLLNLIAVLTVFVFNWILCPVKTVLVTDILLLFGFVPQLAQKQFYKKKVGQTTATRLKATLLGIIVFGLFCGIILSVFPQDTENMRIRGCTDLMAEAYSATKAYPENVKNKSQLSLEYLDLQDESGRIDGAVHSKKQSGYLAEIVDSRNRYFRLCTFDTFNGTHWSNSETDYYRINGFYDDEQRKELTLSDEMKADPIFKKYFEKQDIAIALMGDGKYLYTSTNMEDYEEISNSNNTVLFNNRGEVFSPWDEKAGFTYSYSTYQLNKKTYILDPDVIKDIDTLAEKLDTEIPVSFYEKYTALPKQWSSILSKQAKELPAAGYMETLRQCLSILYYHNIRIIDKPLKLDKNYSPLDQMVRTKSANCVQYSTGLLMMLRANGIPCRLVAGYFSAMPDGKTSYYLSADKSITWIEIYFPGIGWIEINSYYPLDNQLDAPNQSDAPKENEIEEEPEADEDAPPVSKPKKKNKLLIALKYTAAVVGILAAVFIVIIILRYLLSLIFFAKWFVFLIYRKRSSRYLFYFRDILNLLLVFGIPLADGDTMRTLYLKLCDTLKCEADEQYLVIAERICYAGYTPTDSEIAMLIAHQKKLCGIAKVHCRFTTFITKRKIFHKLFILTKSKRKMGKTH